MLLDKDKVSDAVKEDSWMLRDRFSREISAKWNLKMSLEDNLDKNTTRICYQIREWLYQSRKCIEDIDAEAAAKAAARSDFRGDKLLLSKLPKESYPLVRYCYDNESYTYDRDSRYEVYLEASENDPNLEERGNSFYLRAGTLREIISMIKDYLKNYSRPGYDY